MYSANESTGVIQPVLHLSNPSLTDIMVEATISTFGKKLYCDNDMVRLHVAIHNVIFLQELMWIMVLDHYIKHTYALASK